ncbi:MAG TPA: hypothetical protein VN914_14125, partial [Polyangia bacterium]|nr:hypothetical protein [Polyangia bacterium]
MTSFHGQEYSGALSRARAERMGCYVLGFQGIVHRRFCAASCRLLPVLAVPHVGLRLRSAHDL